MKLAVLVALFSVSLPLAAAADQSSGTAAAAGAAAPPDKVAEAYDQFLLAHRLEEATTSSGAIAAYKRAMELDPTAADIPGELAGLYLRQNKIQDAMATAEQALKIAPANREAHRVLGTIYAALSESAGDNAPRGAPPPAPPTRTSRRPSSISSTRPIAPTGEADPNVRATLARLYVRSGAYDKAIPLLTDLVNAGARLAGRPVDCSPRPTPAPAAPRTRSRGSRSGRPTTRGCCRRSPISTSASGAGRMRSAPTRARCSGRRATSS